MARDVHRAAVYAAEDQVGRVLDRAGAGASVDFFGSALTIPVERHFADVPSVQRYVDAVLALPVVRTRWPGTGPVRVRPRAGATRAHYEPGGVIAVPSAAWAGRELVVLHEVAHHLVAGTPDGAAQPAHGPAFAATICLLLTEVVGPEAGLLLRAALDGAGVPLGALPEPAGGA